MTSMIMPTGKEFTKSPVFLYGAGRICRDFVTICHYIGVFPDYICDINAKLWGQYIELPNGDKVEIISPTAMKVHGLDNPVIITNLYTHSSMCTLEQHGFTNVWLFPLMSTGLKNETLINDNKSIIQNISAKLSDEKSRKVYNNVIRFRVTGDLRLIKSIQSWKQYFPEFLTLSDDEVFVDGGCYNGNDIDRFIKITNGNFKYYYAFEPQPKMAERVREKLINHAFGNKISFIEKAISDKEKTIGFSILDAGSSVIDYGKEFERIEVKTESLDHFFKDKELKPTFIKFDIEGSEMSGLRGAENIISKCKPKLAIAIYHQLEDLWEIPNYLMSKYKFYDFYIRHHQYDAYDTVFYAIPKI